MNKILKFQKKKNSKQNARFCFITQFIFVFDKDFSQIKYIWMSSPGYHILFIKSENIRYVGSNIFTFMQI